jgi:hypothetical protein
MKRLMGALVLAAAVVASGCEERVQSTCTPNLVDGLVIFIVNVETGAPICDAVLTARDGAYSETLAPGGGCRYSGASERPGSYTLRAEAPGFLPTSTVSAVRVGVTEDGCHVEAARLTIRLTPILQK